MCLYLVYFSRLIFNTDFFVSLFSNMSLVFSDGGRSNVGDGVATVLFYFKFQFFSSVCLFVFIYNFILTFKTLF